MSQERMFSSLDWNIFLLMEIAFLCLSKENYITSINVSPTAGVTAGTFHLTINILVNNSQWRLCCVCACHEKFNMTFQ